MVKYFTLTFFVVFNVWIHEWNMWLSMANGQNSLAWCLFICHFYILLTIFPNCCNWLTCNSWVLTCWAYSQLMTTTHNRRIYTWLSHFLPPLFPNESQIVQVELKSFAAGFFRHLAMQAAITQLVASILKSKIRPRTAQISASLYLYCSKFICLPFLFRSVVTTQYHKHSDLTACLVYNHVNI